jgi:hypothetical protein
MDLHDFIVRRRKWVEEIAEIECPYERLRRLDKLEVWVESVREPGWVIGRRLVASERLRARRELDE